MKEKTTPMLRNVDLTKLHAFLDEDGGDGWTIWDPSLFTDMGFDISDLPVREYKSDTRDPKSTITKNGKVVKRLTGVYGLSLLRKLAMAVGASTDTGMMGRGSEARALTTNIKAALGKQA